MKWLKHYVKTFIKWAGLNLHKKLFQEYSRVQRLKFPELFASIMTFEYHDKQSSSCLHFKLSRNMTKPTKWPVCPVKTQISLGIRLVWSVFSAHLMGSKGSNVFSCRQQRLWSVWADAQADLSLRWAHSHFVGFVMRWLIRSVNILDSVWHTLDLQTFCEVLGHKFQNFEEWCYSTTLNWQYVVYKGSYSHTGDLGPQRTTLYDPIVHFSKRIWPENPLVIANHSWKHTWATSWQNQHNGMCAQQTLISLGICPVWSESSLSAWRKLGSLATHWAHSELWSDWVDAQADLSLCWVHMPFCWFCHEVAHFKHIRVILDLSASRID